MDNENHNELKEMIVKSERQRSFQLFNFCDAFCINRFIYNKKKRNFFAKASKLFSYKLSIESILKLNNEFEIVKKKILTADQFEMLNEPPSLLEQLSEIKMLE